MTVEEPHPQETTTEPMVCVVERNQEQSGIVTGERGKYAVMGQISNVQVPMTLDIGAEDTSCLESVYRRLPQCVQDTLKRPMSGCVQPINLN